MRTPAILVVTMMRVSLVVVLLLASVGTASAECAWVLWGRDSTANIWFPPVSFRSESECCSGHREMNNPQVRAAQEIRRPEFRQHDYFECWPDTVDPRGPKGGGR